MIRRLSRAAWRILTKRAAAAALIAALLLSLVPMLMQTGYNLDVASYFDKASVTLAE